MTATIPIPATGDIDLGQFRFHTGAQPTRLAPEEACPPLFRDIGFEAMARFLRGELNRLCGPLSPITYLRTAQYCEPYVDYGRIGRIMLLRPCWVAPWHSGIQCVYIAPRSTPLDGDTMVFIPSEIPLAEAAGRFADMGRRADVATELGPRLYADMIVDTLDRLDALQRTHEKAECHAARLRRQFQSPNEHDRERAREWMGRAGLSEYDLCTALHHLPADRREHVLAEVPNYPEVPA